MAHFERFDGCGHNFPGMLHGLIPFGLNDRVIAHAPDESKSGTITGLWPLTVRCDDGEIRHPCWSALNFENKMNIRPRRT